MPSGVIDINTGLTSEIMVNGISFIFCGGSAADANFTWKIYAWRNSNGPAELVGSGTGQLGTQAIVKYPHNSVPVDNVFWADKLTVTTNVWFKEVKTTDSTGSNSVAKLWFDACGYRFFLVEIPTSDGNMASYFGYF